MANVVYTGFDPEFGNPLDQLIARAKAEGYAPELISGRRDAYGWPGMKGQSQAELYGQLGRPGGPAAAAPPGYSPHQYGVAADVTGVPQSELARLASQVGLKTIPGDPNHLELANWRQTAATQPPVTPWSEVDPANVPARMAMNVDAPPGTSLSTSPFLTSLQQFESGGRNIPNTHQGTSSGQAQGYNQITTGTWDEFGGKKFAVSPLQATYNQQNAIAANIPLKRWAPETISYLKNQGFKVDPSQTLGQNIAANSAVGPGPGNVGPVTGFLPGQPTGQGPIGSDVVASKDAGAPAAPSIASQIAGPLQSLTKSLDDSGQQQQQGGDQGAQQSLQAQQAAAAYGQQRQMALQQQAAQLMAATMARGQKGLNWGSSPPGAATGLQRSPMTTEMWGGVPIPMPGPTPSPGMTLNSMGDLNYG